MKIHTLLAAFILPVALMFMITGAFYTWGIKGGYETSVYDVSVPAQVVPDKAQLMRMVSEELNRLSIPAPEGQAKVKKAGEHFWLEWTGSSRDVLFEPGKETLKARLTVKDTSFYRQFVQLHKAKGGVAFKVYAVVLSVALGLLLISGFIMAWQSPKLKSMTVMSAVAGLLSFVVFVWLS